MVLNDIIRRFEEKHGCTVGCAVWDADSGEALAGCRNCRSF